MSQIKKRKIADEIAALLQPKRLQDSQDEDEEAAAQIVEFDETEQKSGGLSEFRKRTVKDLTKTHDKYRGIVASRADFEESEEGEEEDESGEELNLGMDDSDDKEDLDTSGEPSDSDEELNESKSEDDLESDASEDEEEEDTSLNLISSENSENQKEKEEAYREQLRIWEKLMEIRINFQPLLLSAHSLPVGEKYQELVENDETQKAAAEAARKEVANVISKLVDLQCNFLEKDEATKDLPLKRVAPDSSVDEFEQALEANFEAQREHRHSVIRKWHDRTMLAANVKKLKQGGEVVDIIERIENPVVLQEILRKNQIYRGNYEIFGWEPPEPVEEGKPVYCDTIYDDSDFYHQLLREFIESKATASSDQSEVTQKLIELQQLRNKMKKKVDTRASKGRKIRYVVHNKLINFMAPQAHEEWTDEAKTELYNSLFDKAIE